MKITRLKRARRVLLFYKSRFGFREPYQVLIDGTFCKAALKSKVNIREQLANYLDGEVKFLTTACAVHETEILGAEFKGIMLVIKQFPIHKCGHEKNHLSPVQCFKSMVGESNQSHYIIATQDSSLQKHLRNIPGTPIIYLHFNAPVLESPSDLSEETADVRNSERVLASEYEKTTLERMKAAAGIKAPEAKKRKKKRGGPNPLSCKKKKVIEQPTSDASNTRSRKRFRVKTPKHVKAIKSEINN
ncbi:hypothetical protein CHUAL_005562 [Chamberlinius hualienensis]